MAQTNQYLEKIAARLSGKYAIESGRTALEVHREYKKRKAKSADQTGSKGSRGTGRKWARGSVNKQG